MTRGKAAIIAAIYIALALLSVTFATTGIMLGDVPAVTDMPVTSVAVISALLLPPVLLFGAFALLLATWADRRQLALAAVLVPVTLLVVHAASLLMLFTWCQGGASRFACRF